MTARNRADGIVAKWTEWLPRELINRAFRLVDEHRSVHVSSVGGEPLVRFRELREMLPRLADAGIHTRVPKLRTPRALIAALADPPHLPDECIFAQTTTCVSAGFTHRMAPCQFGGTPDCTNYALRALRPHSAN